MFVTLFYYIDEFCKRFEEMVRKKTFKYYYYKYVLEDMQKDFKPLFSCNRFIELKARTIVLLALFSKAFCTSSCFGISFIDSFSLKVCNK
jgi:hypothetical protein